MEHFRKGQLITEWSATTVIQSLWSLPEVAILLQDVHFWDAYTACRGPHWQEEKTGELQRRLHLAEDSSRILSAEAYRMLPSDLSEQKSPRHHASISLPRMYPSGQSNTATSLLPTSAERMEDSGHAVDRDLEYPWSSVDHYAGFSLTDCTMSNRLPTSQSDISEATRITEHQRSFHTGSKECPGVSAGGATSSQPDYCSTQVE